MIKLDEGTTIHEQYEITVEVAHDPFMGPPWKEHDGHGPVVEHRYDDHGAKVDMDGMLELARDRDGVLLYNVRKALKIAKRDGWGTEGDEFCSPDAKAARAVDADYKYLRGWCRDEWHWLSGTITVKRPGVEPDSAVTLIDEHTVGGFDTHEAVLEWAAEEVQAAIDSDRKALHEAQAAANRMHETIADIAYAAGVRGWYSGDSRADMASIIAWAEEFEHGRQEDADGNEFYAHPGIHYSLAQPEYMTAVDEFADAKLEEAGAPRPTLEEQREANPDGRAQRADFARKLEKERDEYFRRWEEGQITSIEQWRRAEAAEAENTELRAKLAEAETRNEQLSKNWDESMVALLAAESSLRERNVNAERLQRRIESALLPDPQDEREVSVDWLRQEIRAAIDAARRNFPGAAQS